MSDPVTADSVAVAKESPKGFFRCPHCRQKTITAWTKLRTRAACPSCGGRFVAGSWGMLLAVLVMPLAMFTPMFVLHSAGFPLIWLLFAVGTALTLAVAGVIYLFATPLYRKGSAAARWDTISVLTLVAGITVFGVWNADFSRETGLVSDIEPISVGPPTFWRRDSDGVTARVHYGNLDTQKAFKDALDKAGIPYKLETRKGEEYVGWTSAQDAAVRKLQQELDASRVIDRPGEDLPPGRAAWFPEPARQQAFTDWLTKKGVPYETKMRHGREHVVWEGPEDLGMQYLRERASDCAKTAATAGTEIRKC